MAARSRGPGWRDEVAASLLLQHVPALSLSGPALVMDETGTTVAEGLEAVGMAVRSWSRMALAGRRATAWPPPGPFGTVILRLPRAKEALSMALHAGGSVLEDGGFLLVFGAKDEGIISAAGPMRDLFESVETVAVGGRCRVLQATRQNDGGRFRDNLAAWRDPWDPGLPGLPDRWVSYPGVFAHGALDPGTRLLLEALPDLPSGARVLDYGCGSGIVGALARLRVPEVELHLLDVDAVALEAARENVPGGTIILADGLAGRARDHYDAVLSNPPFHRGKEEDPGMLTAFVREAGRVLKPGGTLTLVTQRRIPIEKDLRACFRGVSILGQDSIFTVWHGKS